jgi:large subunit ribosomal protein L20
MVRVKKGKAAHKHRKHLLKYVKGFRWGRKSKYALAKDAMKHAWKWSYRDRKNKKRVFRQLWQRQISAFSKKQGISYNRLINLLKTNKIELDRKILAKLAQENPEIFEKIIEKLKK